MQRHATEFTTVPDTIALTEMGDTAEEPLISHRSHNHEEDDASYDVDLSDVSLLLEKNLRHPGIYVWLLTFSAGISGLLFGCKLISFTINYPCRG